MSSVSNHIIKAQEYLIELDDRKEAHQVQSNISALQSTRINSLLDTILNSYDTENCIYQFPKIELDLGVISKSNYENELVYRLEEELVRFFNSNILENGTLRNGKKIKLYNSKIEHFEHFLLRGYTPWNSLTKQTPSSLIIELINDNKEKIVALLKKHGKKEAIRKRMIFQFSEELLERIVVEVAGNEGKYIIGYKKDIVVQQEEQRVVETNSRNFKNAIWEVILAYLFVASNGYYNKKAFLKFLIKKISEKYNVSYNSLLKLIAQGVKSENKIPNSSLEFKKIILELESLEELHSDADVPKTFSEKVSVLEWIKEVDHFLGSGRFSSKFSAISQKKFATQLKQLLRSKNSTVVNYVKNWIVTPSKKERLLTFADITLLDEVIKVCPSFFVKANIQFIKDIEKNKSTLSSGSVKLLTKITALRSKLILKAFWQRSHSEKEIIRSFLSGMLQEFDKDEAAVFQLLDEVKERLPKKYHKAISQFLSRFYQKVGRKILYQITEEIQYFTKGNDQSLWSYWAEKQWKRWGKKTGLTKFQLLEQLKKHHIKNKSLTPLISFIENVNSSQGFVELNGKTASVLIDTTPTQNIESNVFFVVQKGELPWWSKGYTIENFKGDFKQVWESTNNRKKILQFLRSEQSDLQFVRLLEVDNLFQIWNELLPSSKNISIDFFKEVIPFLETNYAFIGIISKTEINILKLEISKRLLRGNRNEIDSLLITFFQKWIATSKVLKHKGALQLLLQKLDSIKGIAGYKSLQKELRSVLKNNFASKKDSKDAISVSEASLTQFIKLQYNAIMQESSSETIPLMVQLETIYKVSPKRVDTWLLEANFRNKLLLESEEEELQKFIVLTLNASQQESFKVSFTLLQELTHSLSLKEMKEVKRLYFRLILLKISAGGFTSWSLEHWSSFLLNCLYDRIGKKKSQEILFEIRSEKAVSKSSRKALDKMFDDLTSKKVMPPKEKNENKDYKKLGETEPRAFTDPIFIKNAGLIIMSPFLGTLFEKCGLIKDSEFIDEESKYKAVHLLEFAVTGKKATQENELVLNKLMCGMKVTDPVDITITLTEKEKETVDSLLTAITQHWKALNGSSIDALRSTFLERDGKLEEDTNEYYLKVEQKTFDMLLDQIPWNISKIKLSWMKKLLQVEWR